MSEILGTIKILDGKIITKKGDVTEVWSRWTGDGNQYIVYDGITYKLMKSGGEVVENKRNYFDEESDDEDLNIFRDDF